MLADMGMPVSAGGGKLMSRTLEAFNTVSIARGSSKPE
jgi:hypothetical protein